MLWEPESTLYPWFNMVERMASEIDYLREQLKEEREANRENRRIIAGLVQRVPSSNLR